jgi:glycosyltransferase involved in cell wall biosynthesis
VTNFPARPMSGEPRRYTVAHAITESQPFGGAQRNTLLTLQGLLHRGYRVALVCGPGGRLVTEARSAGVQVHVLDDLVREFDPVRDLRALLQLHRLFRAGNYDIVHTHSAKAGLLGRVAAWLAGIPVVVHTIHGFPFEMTRDWRAHLYAGVERLVGAVTDRVICVGENLRQQAAALRIAPHRKLVTVYSGIDFDMYRPRCRPSDTRRALGLEAASPIVGSVGYLVEAKAQHYLLEAVALLRAKYPRIMLLLCGEGPLRPCLERRIEDLGVGAHVRLLGERDDIADLLGVFDVYAMSSRREGVGRALSEAMYRGLPVVTTAVDGVGELVVHDETGLLVPPHDPPALATAIERLVSDGERARRLGAAARLKVRQLMGVERMIEHLTTLYQALAAVKCREDDLLVAKGAEIAAPGRSGVLRRPESRRF